MHFDVILRHGELIDGTGAARFSADLGVRGAHIAAIGDLSHASADQVIDVSGRIVAPGFIDSHTHDDAFVLTDPDVEPKVAQGVTTVVAGNCGISLAPLLAEHEVPQPLDLLGAWQRFRFPSFAAYLDALDATPAAVNTAALVGHSTLRVRHVADLQREANAAEIAAMRADVREAMAAGAFGVSSGTFYPPAAAATQAELIDVCAPLRDTGGVFATHLRDETAQILASLDEAFAIGRALGVRVVLSHHKVAGKENHGRSVETLARIDAQRALQPLCLDCHPYTATSTMLRADRIRQSSRVMLAWSKPHPELAGRDFHELLPLFGDSVDAAIDALRPAGAIYFVMDEGDVERIFRHDLTMVGSDGLPNDTRPHPRLWGTFPRVLGEFSRRRGLFPLETAVHKMTGLTAAQFGLAGRGELKVGHCADLVVFDPERVLDRATFEHPTLRPEGIDHVFVNGRAVLAHGQHTGARPGRALRRQAGTPIRHNDHLAGN
ncbi:N-acyl-D-amino-acid deacylase [Burkholderia multivorans]|uniref:D-aminoacylase n=1 Tax=Burkholderia multivorans TaxID=87883 RepID=A0A8B3VHP8_9BURK|nr:D-aminoacylase [Burkholderia multivorans]KGC07203.1 D-aminoacylase [Burkholderia multivorans]KVP27747.1 D-aminoacylase [Burkholderia multivorans]MBJ9622730.1 D-aminoacylase [Burkholderia multivorans]MBU9134309.1 D-aminoacylase [Burkholderia multivorans]MBU9294524.1 D-aminoacylase [Burkholderia multivorans]